MALLAPDRMTVVEVTGADRATYLDNVTTQKVDGAPLGSVSGALVLDAKGSPLAAFWVLVHAERLALLVPEPAVSHIMEVLARRTFLADVTFTQKDDPVWAMYGTDVDSALRAAGVSGLERGSWRPVGDSLVVRHDFGVQLVGDDLAARLQQADGVVTGDEDALDRARIEVGEPQLGREVAAGRLPEEFGLMASHVHLAKGCYPGQEAVAHMWNLGRPRRRLVRARLSRPDAMHAGWTAGEGRERAEVTATAGEWALALVPPDSEVGTAFDGDDGARLEVVELVGDGPPGGFDPARPQRRNQ